MQTIHDAADIRSFVIQTLGCRCPASVFELIDCDENSTLPGIDTPLGRLLIGNRLLIYIFQSGDLAALRNVLPRLVEEARAERDRSGYNRLRIVVAADQIESTRRAAEHLFPRFPDIDDRAHLHVLGPTSVPIL
ncbi:MAG: hypothetical protein MUF20_05070 [Methylotetracoccus sp.]|jgi:hypothetical protein|nr:hypothetical protein [Methylotetracoccus sp.]